MNIVSFYRIAHQLHVCRVPLLPRIIYYLQFLLFNSVVPYQCAIGKGTRCAYGGIGVVIHERAVIGKNCIIGQGVTIGGRSKIVKVPKIGNNVYLGAGCRILGDVEIGDEVVIGANAVVTKNIPSRCVAAGVPARILKSGIKMEDYINP